MKEVKKNYKVKVIKDGEIINEIKLRDSKKKILVHKVDLSIIPISNIKDIHESLTRLNPKLKVLTIPKECELEILEIID